MNSEPQVLETKASTDSSDVRRFFDREADRYQEAHGDAAVLLARRIEIIRRLADLRPDETVVEIGCGPGQHLLELAGSIHAGLGIDLSPRMVGRALESRPPDLAGKVDFAVDSAESLANVEDASVDCVFCVGALEHMVDQGAVARSAFRVLRTGGRFVVLTLNGGALWYRLAPWLGFQTRRLETDRYLRRSELEAVLAGAGFADCRFEGWTFVQRGDMPDLAASALSALDRLGRLAKLQALRGGLAAVGVVPPNE